MANVYAKRVGDVIGGAIQKIWSTDLTGRTLFAIDENDQEVIDHYLPDITMTRLRGKRDRRLDRADIKFINPELWHDLTASKKNEWRTYKQTLRDMPATVDLTGIKTKAQFDALFPTKPS